MLAWLDFVCISNKSITWSNADLKSEKNLDFIYLHLTCGEWDVNLIHKKKEIEWFVCETYMPLEFGSIPLGSQFHTCHLQDLKDMSK